MPKIQQTITDPHTSVLPVANTWPLHIRGQWRTGQAWLNGIPIDAYKAFDILENYRITPIDNDLERRFYWDDACTGTNALACGILALLGFNHRDIGRIYKHLVADILRGLPPHDDFDMLVNWNLDLHNGIDENQAAYMAVKRLELM